VEAANADRVRRSFAGQAAAFEDPSRAFASADVAAWMTANSPTSPSDLVLEVAAGTGLFGRALAPLVAAVVAVDLTPEMLREGQRGAGSAGLSNIVFQLGDATRLPFLDGSFDRVVSRLAIHHFDDPLLVLQEMVRVCRRGGTVTVIDMVVPDAADQRAFNDLERRRDPAHTRALTRDELRAAVECAGLDVVHTATWENVLDGERWMEQTSPPLADAEHIRAAWRAELAGGPRTGMDPRWRDGRIEFVHHWDLLVGVAEPARAG
jgi:SAM-dependent methyltransferase